MRPNGIRKAFWAAALSSILPLCFSEAAAAQFETRAIVSVGDAPTSIAVGDFNHDGKPDIAVAAANALKIEVFLGRGDGTFQAPLTYPDPAIPMWIVVADLNRDGILDIVAANHESSISVLLGNGDGTFQTAKNFNLKSMSDFLAVGDFNGDHIPDLVVANSPYVSVMLGNGDGTFQPPIDNMTLPTHIPGIAIGDFNGDGKLDVAAAAPNSGFVAVALLLGNGDGTLQPAILYPVNHSPQSVVAVDLNRDGKLDLAYEAGLGVLLGNGDGTFQPEVDYSISGQQVIVGDFNGDGKIDLAAASLSFPTDATVALGNGDGTFGPAINYRAGSEPRFIAEGDFNGDHQLDLIVTDYLNNHVIVLANTGMVTFAPSFPLNFASQVIDTNSAPQTVTLTNNATVPLAISSIKLAGQFRWNNNTCGAIVAPDASCALSVTFKPLSKGSKSGAITIFDSASTKPQVILLAGVGTVVNLVPSRLAFPDQKIGTSSNPKAVVVTNDSTSSLVFTDIKLSGQDAQQFSQTNTCGSQIGPGASCTVSVIFQPKKAEELHAQLVLTDNGGDQMQLVPLTGTGTH